MSQQPPPGPSEPQQPYQQPGQPYQQPYTPYSQGAYPNPYAQFPQPPKSNTTRNVLLIVGLVVVLFCGGIVAFFAWAVSNVDDAFDNDYRGSDKKPLTVSEGDAFSIRGFDYDKGWTVATDDAGSLSVEGLRVTNNRDDKDSSSVSISFDFYQDNARVSTVSCTGGSSITYERTAQLTCTGYEDKVPYDEIEVHDGSYYD